MFNKPVPGTNIIPCKVPLDRCHKQMFEEENIYGLATLLDAAEAQNYAISSIIDLNRSDIYYDFNQLENRVEFPGEQKVSNKPVFIDTDLIDSPVTHFKVPTSHRTFMDNKEAEIKQLFSLLDEKVEFSDNPSSYILIHCFHGVHRTGVLITLYLSARLGIKKEKALALFEEGRGHQIGYGFLTDFLRDTDEETTDAEQIESMNL